MAVRFDLSDRQRMVNMIAITPLIDAWAVRHLHVCVRDMEKLSPFALDLVKLMQADVQTAQAPSP